MFEAVYTSNSQNGSSHIIQVLDEDYEVSKIMCYFCLTDDYTKTET